LNRAALHELEKDTADKFIALNLDQTSRRFQNTSRGIHYQDGIERVDNTSVARTLSSLLISTLRMQYAQQGRCNRTVSFRPSSIRPLQQRAAGLLLWVRQLADIDRLLHGRRRSSTVPQHGAQQQMRVVPRL